MAPVTIEQVYDAAASGNAQRVDLLLQGFSASARLHDAGALALRGMKHVLEGDVPGATALLKRAAEHATTLQRPYVVDLLVPLLVSAGDFAAADEALDSLAEIPVELFAVILSAKAVLAAHRGDDELSVSLTNEALEEGRALDSLLIRARVLQRAALTAFYREDFYEAQDRATEAARAFERVESHRHAANAYTILYAIAHGWLGDPDLALLYAQKIATSGKAAGDLSMHNLGLVAQMEIAAESSDSRRLGSVRARLLANRMNEQYRERFPFVLSEILVHGWQGHIAIARSMCETALRDAGRSRGERATCEAMLALLAVASWDLEDVRRYVRLAINHSSQSAGPEALYEQRRRRTARIVAAAACILTGEPSRGQRALSGPFDPDRLIARILNEEGMDEGESPALLRGYARVINVVRAASLRNRPQHGLTGAEMRILRALPGGTTVATIAGTFGRSQKTVERQLTSIYGKLDVKNRAQAIQRARDLGIHA